MLTLTYRYYPPGGSSPQYTYGYDSVGRLNTMSNGITSSVTGATYNAAMGNPVQVERDPG